MQRTAGAASQMTYHSISAELEQENCALEDLHMFFVAFYKRQRKIIEKFEQGQIKSQVQLGSRSVTEKVKHELLLQGKTDELNVDILE